jgi:hypothetical protein
MLTAMRQFDFRDGNPGITLAGKVNAASNDWQIAGKGTIRGTVNGGHRRSPFTAPTRSA